MKGKFIPILIPFKRNDVPVSPEDQAVQILSAADELMKNGICVKTGIIYSANYDQTKSIHHTYQNNKAITDINGANQAQVMYALEKLLTRSFSHLQHKFRIVPITTISYSGYDGFSHEAVIKNDLYHLESLLQNGWCIFGWMNQHTAPEFAIGGGIASLSEQQNHLIQSTLKKFAEIYT
jgi:hypothetical protein